MNDLWERARERTEHALAVGALSPIETEVHRVIDDGARFAVRLVSSRRARSARREDNPFLHYDENLFVQRVGLGHVLLLNKFPVFDRHLLLVTREPEDQETLLTERDFDALWLCADDRTLAFYNAGKIAGASQRHRHLQLVPLPLDEGPESTPLEPMLRELPFPHAFGDRPRDPQHDYACYRSLLASIECENTPYNLLVTSEWMLVVPRRRECFESISVNALGFVGSLLVGDRDELALVQRVGPLAILQAVTT